VSCEELDTFVRHRTHDFDMNKAPGRLGIAKIVA
jgi:hypothetical protein